VTSWNTGYVESDGERIYWERAGEGVPIVLCHGAGSNHLSFYHQVPGLSSAGHQVIVWDQRGYGNSTLVTGEIGIAVAGRDLSAVLDANGLDATPVHLVGQALGALVVSAWAVANPHRVLSLALLDGPFAASADGSELIWTLEPTDDDVRSNQVDREVGRTAVVSAAFAERDPAGTYLYQSLLEVGNARPSYSQLFAAAKAEPVSIRRLASLDRPVLIGRGECDQLADADALERLVSLVPRASTVTIPGSGHAPYLESPTDWNRSILAFVDRRDTLEENRP
jgi:3-oxoadipate enol-lactonase